MITPEDKRNLVVGFKQVCKAVKSGKCSKIYLAEDCSSNISDNLLATAGDIQIISVPTMHELGSMCEIDVPASCAAIIRL